MTIQPKEIQSIINKYNDEKIKRISKVPRKDHLQKCFIITTNKNLYFLKTYQKNKFKIAKNGLKLIKFLEEKKYPTLKIFKTKKGELFIIHKKTPATLWEIMKEKENKNITAREAFELGKYLGLLHRITKEYSMQKIKSYNRDKKMFEESYSFYHLAPKRVKKVLDYLNIKIEQLKVPSNVPMAICHEEYSIQHVRFKNEKLVKVFDWEGTGKDYIFYDLGLTLSNSIKNKKINFRRMNYMLEGYETQRKLTNWGKKHLFECVLFGALKYFCWGNGKEEIEKAGWNMGTVEVIEILIKNEKDFYLNLAKQNSKCCMNS
jgi:Ser/Thr protein kinase RdoA (MazF antagonist)